MVIKTGLLHGGCCASCPRKIRETAPEGGKLGNLFFMIAGALCRAATAYKKFYNRILQKQHLPYYMPGTPRITFSKPHIWNTIKQV
jgi:hypothetical protein